jgi:hypothetical protein
LNNEVINEYLKHYSSEIKPDQQAVLIWRQSRFRTGKKMQVPANNSIVELPLWSPGMNPAENF